MQYQRIAQFSLLVIAAAVLGCANPATDKPRAVVEEPAPQPETESAGELYRISNDSTIGFVGSKVTGQHHGGFKAFEGEIRLVNSAPEQSSVHLLIDATSLWADNPKLTGHLQSPDFFDVATHSAAEFTSTEIVPEGEAYRVTGNLLLHGVEKSITFPATIEVGEGSVSVSAEFSILRFDFEIEYKGMADDLIRDDVLIQLDLKATPAT